MRRFIAALNAFWFVLSFGAPQLMHPCPEHSATIRTESGHSGHGMHQDAPDSPERDSGCCCPGPQCGAHLLALAVSAPAAFIPSASSSSISTPAGPATAHARWLLPFATAPPATVS